MKTLRLRPVGLAALDESRLEVFLRFVGRTARHRWTLAHEGEADLLVCERGGRAALGALPGGRVAVIVERSDEGPVAPGDVVLRRTMNLEQFAALLRDVEADREGLPGPGQATAGVMESGLRVRPLEARAGFSPALGAHAPWPAEDVRESGRAWRLRRWPGTDVLRAHPKYVRMLGFLGQRPVSLPDLKALSGVDEATCVGLLESLRDRGLLQASERISEPPSGFPASVFQSTSLPEEVSPSTGDEAPGGPIVRRRGPGLLDRLRARWGLA